MSFRREYSDDDTTHGGGTIAFERQAGSRWPLWVMPSQAVACISRASADLVSRCADRSRPTGGIPLGTGVPKRPLSKVVPALSRATPLARHGGPLRSATLCDSTIAVSGAPPPKPGKKPGGA
jgi:hypothetical protein